MRLLTWNVQWCRGLDGVVDPARIAREARRLADPDVLCLQEVSVGFISLPGSHGENQVDACATTRVSRRRLRAEGEGHGHGSD